MTPHPCIRKTGTLHHLRIELSSHETLTTALAGSPATLLSYMIAGSAACGRFHEHAQPPLAM